VADLPRIISVDDHVVEPPTLWQDRLPARYRDVGPRVVREPAGVARYRGGIATYLPDDSGRMADWWHYEDLRVPMSRLSAAVGYPRDEVDLSMITYDDMRPGCYQVDARLADMDVNWVEASLCFPMFPRFCGQTFHEAKDKDLALLCVRAYNDWMVEEWCGASGGRLLPLCLIPLWDIGQAVVEVGRNAGRGVRAVAFSELPGNLGLPSVHDPDRYWDPLFEACNDTGTVVCIHIGSGSTMPSTSSDAPAAVGATLTFNNAMGSLTDWLFSGLFVRFPDLVVAYSEGQIGWIPYVLERADVVWEKSRGWAGVRDIVPDPPSSYFRRHVYGCVFEDAHGLRCVDEIGVDNITFESDYPHSDSTWPDTRAVAERQLRGLPPDVVHKIVRGNASRLFGLPEGHAG
jgi:predicted TIM-barrel fold metal-dependent hydrolase